MRHPARPDDPHGQAPVGLRWQRAREDAGLEQRDAAALLAIHPVTLSRYETGARKIPAAVQERMATVYKLASQPPVQSLAYWSGRLDQMVDHLRRVVSEQTELADQLRRAAQSDTGGPLAEEADPIC